MPAEGCRESFSMTSSSVESDGQEARGALSTRTKSASTLLCSSASRQAADIPGCRAARASTQTVARIVCKPLFHKYCPRETYFRARSESGFSTKAAISSAPERAASCPSETAAWKASLSVNTWSADITSTVGALPSRTGRHAVSVSAGAVFRSMGSSAIRTPSTPVARNCSATMRRCSWLQTTIVGVPPRLPPPNPFRWRAVSCSMVCWPVGARSCLGRLSRDDGQRRVPDPPEKMTVVSIWNPRFRHIILSHCTAALGYSAKVIG